MRNEIQNHLTFIYLSELENSSKSPQQFHHVALCPEAPISTMLQTCNHPCFSIFSVADREKIVHNHYFSVSLRIGNLEGEVRK